MNTKRIQTKTTWFAATLALALCGAGVQAATFTVTNTNNDGPGSLRAAVSNANANAGADMVDFNIPGAGPHTINLLSTVFVGDTVTIDGYTQPGASANTLTQGLDADLRIVLGGGGGGIDGLALFTANSTVRGLVVNGFSTGIATGTTAGQSNNVIVGCFIGTDATGTTAVPNSFVGVELRSPFNRLGGTDPADRNLISGNNQGVGFSGLGNENLVQGNLIGTDKTGTLDLGNTSFGVRTSLTVSNRIGGATSTPGLPPGNVISGNGAGIRIGAGGQHFIQGNLIGRDATGAQALPNSGNGIRLEFGPTGVTVGGTADGEGNVIAHSGSAGIVVSNGTAHAILGNDIFLNGALGIDLTGDGVTPNDGCDPDSGANNLQNRPELTMANNITGGIRIQGFLDKVANASYRIEFFASSACDPSGFGEGEIFLGSMDLASGGGCVAAIDVTLPVVVPDGHFITATTTDENNNTSEFSECVQAEGAASVVACSLAPQSDTNLVGEVHTVVATVTSNGVPLSGVTVDFDVTAGPNLGETDSDTTDANGEAVFQYTSNGTPGTDTISATGMVDSVSFSCEATKLWLAADPNLVVTKIAFPNPASTASNLVYTITVTNVGPLTATGVVLTDTLSSGVTFSTASPNCTNIAGTVVCDLGSLASGAGTDIAIIVVPNADGTVTNTVSVVANETDANPADNTDTTVTTVASPPMGDDLTVEIDAAPITTTPTPKGPAYGTSGAISLANNGVVYGMADFTVDMMDATKPPKPGKPLKPKWAFNLQITNLTFDLGANPSARLNVYLSDDAVFDASDTALLKAGKEPTTAALDALAQVFKAPKLGAKVPKSTNLSGKFVLVVIDFDDQVDESNENNNAAALGPIP